MPKQTKARRYADDAPLSTKELGSARRLRDSDPELKAALRKSRGRPAGRNKETVHISLDSAVVDALRKSGKGWQTRLNELLRAAIGLAV